MSSHGAIHCTRIRPCRKLWLPSHRSSAPSLLTSITFRCIYTDEERTSARVFQISRMRAYQSAPNSKVLFYLTHAVLLLSLYPIMQHDAAIQFWIRTLCERNSFRGYSSAYRRCVGVFIAIRRDVRSRSSIPNSSSFSDW
jgi:hypothetical protein